MTRLETQQRGLLAIIKRRPADLSGDEWLGRVAGSREADMVREIALWWRRFQIESQCRYTTRLLKRLDGFEEAVAAYFENTPTSPSVEELAAGFLKSLNAHANPLVVSVSSFERACLQLADQNQRDSIVWRHDPSSVLQALDQFTELPRPDEDFLYVMQVGADIPGQVRCVRLLRRGAGDLDVEGVFEMRDGGRLGENDRNDVEADFIPFDVGAGGEGTRSL